MSFGGLSQQSQSLPPEETNFRTLANLRTTLCTNVYFSILYFTQIKLTAAAKATMTNKGINVTSSFLFDDDARERFAIISKGVFG